jgi:hypothetical protein
MLSTAKSVASFLRWRLTPIRYAGRLRFLNPSNFYVKYKPIGTKAKEIEADGYSTGPTISSDLLKDIQQIYVPRTKGLSANGSKAPFINLNGAEDFTADSPLMKFAFSPEVLDVALDYFGDHLRFDKIQVLYSFPTDSGELKESQKWHLDYNDSRTLHCVAYLTDVLDDQHGPFALIDKHVSKKVGRGLIVRRIDDKTMLQESGGAKKVVVYGKAGTSVFVDPAVCYHYGSRCRVGRLAVFVTFSSDKPFVHAMPLARQNAARILAAAKTLRADLPAGILERVMDI